MGIVRAASRAVIGAFHQRSSRGIVAAGGLGPESVGLVEPLYREFPDLSIDAQGKLRPSGSALHPIDWDMAETYLVKALQLLR